MVFYHEHFICIGFVVYIFTWLYIVICTSGWRSAVARLLPVDKLSSQVNFVVTDPTKMII